MTFRNFITVVMNYTLASNYVLDYCLANVYKLMSCDEDQLTFVFET